VPLRRPLEKLRRAEQNDREFELGEHRLLRDFQDRFCNNSPGLSFRDVAKPRARNP
jgi:hypothetical protein